MRKLVLTIIILSFLTVFSLSGCSKAGDDKITENISNTITGNKSEEDKAGDIGDQVTILPSITSNMEASDNKVKKLPAQETDVNYDPNFKVVIEAEEAEFTGNIKVEGTKEGFSGTGYLTGIETDKDTITFRVTVPGNGAYDLNFVSAANTEYKENNVLLDGENIGLSIVDKDDFTDSMLRNVYLTSGEHEIQMTKSWGWVLVDKLIITASAPMDTSIYEVSYELSDPMATDRAKGLMKYLTDMYGEYIISGQYGDLGIHGSEFKAIKEATGKYPAMLGLDLIEYTPSRAANGSIGYDVDYALVFDKKGGIVTFCWHWNAPEPYLINSDRSPWWKGFYADSTTINLDKIMKGEDQEGYDLLVRDIDAIAVQLLRLQKADIPILWRPLHEASGGWFWWGASGAEAYIKLYQLLYDRLTNYHNLHNLIWVWNGQNKDWYPGDEYVDIVGMDIYPGEKVYTSQAAKFHELSEWQSSKKMIALTENSCLFDPELAVRDNAMWSYFGTWEGDFVTVNGTYTLSEQYTEADMLKKVYTSDRVITLDELPDLKTYGN